MVRDATQLPPWFIIGRYGWVKQLLEGDPSLLCHEFELRAMALSDPSFRTWVCGELPKGDGRLIQISDGPPPDAEVSDELTALLEAEAAAKKDNPYPFLEPAFPATAMTAADAARLVSKADTWALSIDMAQWNGADVREHLSIDSHVLRRNPPKPEDPIDIHCRIRLDYSDEAILETLRGVLPIWRRQLNEVAGRNHAEPQTANIELDKVYSYRLIPIIDLKLWASQEGIKIPTRVLAAAVFPDGQKGEDDLRKTIEPLLKKLLNRQGNNNLMSAGLIRSLPSKQGK